MTTAVILDRDLTEDIEMAFEHQSKLKFLDPRSSRYLSAEDELEVLYRDIGWQIVWMLEGGRR